MDVESACPLGDLHMTHAEPYLRNFVRLMESVLIRVSLVISSILFTTTLFIHLVLIISSYPVTL